MITLTCFLSIRSRTVFVQIIRNMTHKVFVYGTLKRNEPNHMWLTKPENGIGKFVSEGKTKEKYPLIIATKYNIPFLLYSPGDGYHVKGEIYEVDDKMLGQLDILEDHPKYYEREIDEIITKDGNTEKCWVYFLKKFKRELLKRDKMDNYSSLGSHGLVYRERSKRDPSYDYRVEVWDGKKQCNDLTEHEDPKDIIERH